MLARYEGSYAAAPLIVMGDRGGFAWQPAPEYNWIDTLVYEKLRQVQVLPAEVCTDAEFLRRLQLVLTGLPPTPEEVRAFLQDPRPSREKHDALVDRLREMPLALRREMPGLNPKRADIIVAGAVAVSRLARWLDVGQILVNERGIRDGLLLSMMGERAPRPAASRDRMESVRAFADVTGSTSSARIRTRRRSRASTPISARSRRRAATGRSPSSPTSGRRSARPVPTPR